jgi:tetratricopeptide (TPR) repeat protein/DNA-binding XRE family transcriptional regulator
MTKVAQLPRPLRPLNPHASWPALFGAAVQHLRLQFRERPIVTQEEFGGQLGYSGATVSAIERGTLRPPAKFVEQCEKVLETGGTLRAMLPFVLAEWDEWDRIGRPSAQSISPAEVFTPGSPELAAITSTSGGPVVQADSVGESLELMRLAEASDVGPGVLEAIDRTVDRYCRDYPTEQPDVLIPKVRRQLAHIRKLLTGRTRLDQRRHLLVAAGWLTVLLACLQNDMGDRDAAEANREAAYQLGKEAGHEEIMAWSFELLAWFALVDGKLRDLIDYARTGIDIAPNTSAGIQLAVQEAKAWSRAGMKKEADAALRHAAKVLSGLPAPEHPEHHFVFDAPKLSFYASTCYVWLGEPEPAEEHAREVVGSALDDLSPNRWPMRFAETSVDLGLVAAYRDDIDQAANLGTRALSIGRKSAAAFGRFAELDEAMTERAPKEPAVRDFHERFTQARRELPDPGR